MRLVEINVYPVKSARGIALEAADVLAGGLRHDRRFMVLAESGEFLTQRTHPALALLTTALTRESLVIGEPGGASVEVALVHGGARRTVRVRYGDGRRWNDDVEAVDVPGDAAELISRHLGEPCTLVFMPDDVVRSVESPYGRKGDRVGFADAYPVLLATRASLDDLNARLTEPLPMSRFRPNLVVEGGAPFEEDRHGRVRVGSMTFRMPKRCARCAVTLVDQETAAIGAEPLRTLAAYRTDDNKVYFAQNMIPDGTGTVALDDEVVYLEPVTR